MNIINSINRSINMKLNTNKKNKSNKNQQKQQKQQKQQNKIPIRYLPPSLSRSDKQKQLKMLNTSKKLYKQGKYYTRKQDISYKNKPSKHILHARKIYKINNITPNHQLARATGCSLAALKQIVRKGEGAYYSSGSRPNQTPQSWGLARLASAITSGKAAAVDFHILNECNHKKKAYLLAKSAKKKYGYGHGKTKKISII